MREEGGTSGEKRREKGREREEEREGKRGSKGEEGRKEHSCKHGYTLNKANTYLRCLKAEFTVLCQALEDYLEVSNISKPHLYGAPVRDIGQLLNLQQLQGEGVHHLEVRVRV